MAGSEILEALWLHYGGNTHYRRWTTAELWTHRNGFSKVGMWNWQCQPKWHECAWLYCLSAWFLLTGEDRSVTVCHKVTPVLSPMWKWEFNGRFNKLCQECDQHKPWSSDPHVPRELKTSSPSAAQWKSRPIPTGPEGTIWWGCSPTPCSDPFQGSAVSTATSQSPPQLLRKSSRPACLLCFSVLISFNLSSKASPSSVF